MHNEHGERQKHHSEGAQAPQTPIMQIEPLKTAEHHHFWSTPCDHHSKAFRTCNHSQPESCRGTKEDTARSSELLGKKGQADNARAERGRAKLKMIPQLHFFTGGLRGGRAMQGFSIFSLLIWGVPTLHTQPRCPFLLSGAQPLPVSITIAPP